MFQTGRRSGKNGFLSAAAVLIAVLGVLSFSGCAPENSAEDVQEKPVQEGTVQDGSGYAGKLRISELMAKNRSVLMDENGAFPDWIELENVSGEDISLAGFTISDGEDKDGWTFPEVTIGAGGRLLVYADGTDSTENALHTDFSLSKDETVCLNDAQGLRVDTAECTTGAADIALHLNENGEWEKTLYPTPGYPNTADGYDSWQDSLETASPIVISEVVTANFSTLEQRNLGFCDWVELKNVFDSPVELSDYYLSDDDDALRLWRFPEMTLGAGERVTVICDKAEAGADKGFLHADIELDSEKESLYLSTEAGVADYAFLRDIPYNGSFGRMDGENGWFYFSAPQPGQEKSGGCRRVSAMPEADNAGGVFDGVSGVTAGLSAAGRIYYTLDGSLPTEQSEEYTAPVTLESTAVLRAISVEPGALPSRALTLSYIINENHSLPVASLVSDDARKFNGMYAGKRKGIELPGSISFYADDCTFTIPCGIDMHGETSLDQPKKNMGLHFRGAYGSARLSCDIFGGGVTEFSGLVLRAGQDQNNAVIRSELLENLSLQFSDELPTQRSRYCVLYVNGEYRGIYALMEKINAQYYADLKGVDKDSVTILKAPAGRDSEYYAEVVEFAWKNDLREEENYRLFCERLDTDCLIDWMIIEGYSANTDISTGNVRYARSTQDDGKWRFILYDMDATLTHPAVAFGNVLRPTSTSSAVFITPLMENPEFRERFLTRASEVLNTTLSNENVAAEIDRMADEIGPEIARDFALRGRSYEDWQSALRELRRNITERDWRGVCIKAIIEHAQLSADEVSRYFG